MTAHVLQAVLKDLFSDRGLVAHVVWPVQASECDGFHKGGFAFLWEDAMLEDNDCAVCGVKDNELGTDAFGPKGRCNKSRSWCTIAFLYCTARSAMEIEMFIEWLPITSM